jgi:IclR family transcriptional regulator, mhp operon transcriptional activator
MAALVRNGSMARADKIRGLERGLRVLQALQSSSILSLHEIHQATRISKPSLLRILNTLEHVGFVSRRLADGHYRISAFARMGRKRDRYDRVAEAAAPVLDRLCQKVSWPSDLMVHRRVTTWRFENRAASARRFRSISCTTESELQ